MRRHQTWAAIVIITLVAVLGRAAEPTALQLIQEANRYVGEQCKDKVVQIRSDKSVGGLSPNVWWVVFYDPTATLKATEVKLGGGKMLEVKRPLRLLEPIRGHDEPLDRRRLKIDSDRAIKIAATQPVLDRLKLTATALKLERGPADQPVWRVRVWAAKLREPGKEANLGEVVLSAEDGTVLRNDLRIHRVD